MDIIAAELSGYDIIGISETHLDNTISNADIVIPGFYSPIRKDRNRHGGCVALYISNKMSYVESDDLLSTELEVIWCEIHANCKKFLVGIIYRPPNVLVQYWDHFCLNMEKAMQSAIPIFLLGDFNVNILSEQSRNFKLLLQRMNLHNEIIHDPTNFSSNVGTCINLILTNNTNPLLNTFISPPFCSTHFVISVEVKFTIYKQYAYMLTKGR